MKLLDRKAFLAVDKKRNPEKYSKFGADVSKWHVGIDMGVSGSAGGSSGSAGGAGGSMVTIHPNCRSSVVWVATTPRGTFRVS